MASSMPSSRQRLPRPTELSSNVVTVAEIALLILGLAVFLVAGSGAFGLSQHRAVPIYVYLCLILLLYQAVLWGSSTLKHRLLVFGYSAVAIVFAGLLAFGGQEVRDWFSNGNIYAVANAFLLVAFVIDAFRTRHQNDLGGSTLAQVARTNKGAQTFRPRLILLFTVLASDCAGFALLALTIMFSLLVLQAPPTFVVSWVTTLAPNSGPAPHIPPVPLPFFQPFGITQLWILDLLLAFVALIGVGISAIGALLLVELERAPIQFGTISYAAARHLWLMLRNFAFFPWLAATFAIALVSEQVNNYYAATAQTFSSSGVDVGRLFNPLDPQTVDIKSVLIVLIGLGLAVLAVLLIALAAVLTERDRNILPRALRLAGAAAKLAYVAWMFVYVLAVINAVWVMTHGKNVPEPFQVGAAGLVALAAFVVALIIWQVRRTVLRS
jgi:hypothetical protein